MREERMIEFDTPADPRDVSARALDLLANQIRSLYCICFREVTGDETYGTHHMLAWDGDPEGLSGSRRKKVWPKIAETIARCDADPFVFIRAQFYAVKRATPPPPNICHGDAAIRCWELFRDTTRRDITNKIESDINQIQIHMLPFTVNLNWSDDKALDYTLRDPNCGTSPLVRYCYAVAASLPVAAEFHERALLQYMFQMSDYDNVLQDRIPSQLKAEARECRRRLVGRD